LSKVDHAQLHGVPAMRTNVQQQSGRWAGQDAQMTERMDAIRNPKTMAGSPDAGRRARTSVSPSCAWSLCFKAPCFRETMKED
jgi:hypothetical protein